MLTACAAPEPSGSILKPLHLYWKGDVIHRDTLELEFDCSYDSNAYRLELVKLVGNLRAAIRQYRHASVDIRTSRGSIRILTDEEAAGSTEDRHRNLVDKVRRNYRVKSDIQVQNLSDATRAKHEHHLRKIGCEILATDQVKKELGPTPSVRKAPKPN